MKLNFLGNGSGFAPTHNNAYFITKDNDLILIDLSMSNYHTVTNFPLHKYNNMGVIITHMHDDHISGIGMLIQYCYYVLKKKLTLYIASNMREEVEVWLNIKGIPSDIYNIVTCTDENQNLPIWMIKWIPCTHSPQLEGKCYGLVLQIDDVTCIYSGDTNNIKPFKPYLKENSEFYIDISYSYGSIHCKYDDIKEELETITANGVSVILMHIDKMRDIERVIRKTRFEIAKIKTPNYYSNPEIEIIKNEFCFNKSDIINRIFELMDIAVTETERLDLESLSEEIKEQEFEPIIPDFTKKEITGYFIDIERCRVVRTIGYDLQFEYSNYSHELYLSAYTWNEE